MSYEATQAEYAEAFGIELPEESTGTEPEAEAGQVEETTPAETTEQTESTEAQTEPQEAEPEKQEMPMEERANWAERRRQWEAREQQAREQAAQARVDQVYADIFKGQNNPFTGAPIQTEADYKAYLEERSRMDREEQLKKAGIDPQTIQSMVDQQMAPMRMQMEQARLKAIAEQAKTVSARAEEAMKKELQKITALDPNVKTMEDIAAMPTGRRFNELVQRGIGLEEAFYLANRQQIEERKLAAAKAAAQTQMAGKGHLNPMGAVSGKTPVQVPRGVVDAYRTMMPDATDAEIQKAYEDAMKTMK